MIWKRLLRRWKVDQELDEEIRAHLRMAVEQRVAQGEDPREAEQNARREFGNELLVRETLARSGRGLAGNGPPGTCNMPSGSCGAAGDSRRSPL